MRGLGHFIPVEQTKFSWKVIEVIDSDYEYPSVYYICICMYNLTVFIHILV